MKSKRKATKPVTLLTKIQSLLGDVLDELSSIEKSVERNVRELLQSAETSVSKAKDLITPVLAFTGPNKPLRSKRRAGARRSRPARRAR